jgi:hypothetical protein
VLLCAWASRQYLLVFKSCSWQRADVTDVHRVIYTLLFTLYTRRCDVRPLPWDWQHAEVHAGQCTLPRTGISAQNLPVCQQNQIALQLTAQNTASFLGGFCSALLNHHPVVLRVIYHVASWPRCPGTSTASSSSAAPCCCKLTTPHDYCCALGGGSCRSAAS